VSCAIRFPGSSPSSSPISGNRRGPVQSVPRREHKSHPPALPLNVDVCFNHTPPFPRSPMAARKLNLIHSWFKETAAFALLLPRPPPRQNFL